LRKAIGDLYIMLEDNFVRMMKACAADDEREEVKALYSAARDAHWKAIHEDLDDGNPVVEGLHKDLVKVSGDIKASLESLQNVVALLKLVKEGVKLAAAIVSLAATA